MGERPQLIEDIHEGQAGPLDLNSFGYSDEELNAMPSETLLKIINELDSDRSRALRVLMPANTENEEDKEYRQLLISEFRTTIKRLANPGWPE